MPKSENVDEEDSILNRGHWAMVEGARPAYKFLIGAREVGEAGTPHYHCIYEYVEDRTETELRKLLKLAGVIRYFALTKVKNRISAYAYAMKEGIKESVGFSADELAEFKAHSYAKPVSHKVSMLESLDKDITEAKIDIQDIDAISMFVCKWYAGHNKIFNKHVMVSIIRSIWWRNAASHTQQEFASMLA